MGGAATNVPDAVAAPTCVCPGRIFGTPTPGVTLGYWEPSHLLERTRTPYCSPTLGTTLASTDASTLDIRNFGGHTDVTDGDDGGAYYNLHIFRFPLGAILDMVTDSVCVSDSGYDLDLLYLSEIDPTWTNDELALVTTPEAALFANPVAIAACLADAGAATSYKPLEALFWCAGAWGQLYPLSGHTPASGSPPREAALAGTRGLAAMHRRGLFPKTMGDSAVCANHPFPTLLKQQYKLQTFFPVPELVSNHWIGASTVRWGEWRNVPVTGEDFVDVVSRWEDCCVNE